MRNKIFSITTENAKSIIEILRKKNIYIAELQGEQIPTLSEYYTAVAQAFQFPELFEKYRNFDSYLDWIRDLTWLTYDQKYDGFALFIYDYEEKFMRGDLVKKVSIIETFSECILPWWEEEVIHCTNNGCGIPRLFNLYLVERNMVEDPNLHNRIVTIQQAESKKVIVQHKNEGLFTAELFGENIPTLGAYYAAISKVFKFPSLFHKYQDFETYLIYMKDLRWILKSNNYNGFSLFIYDYAEKFLRNDLVYKEKIIRTFSENILPWWENDIAYTKRLPRPFYLHLIRYCQ